MKAATSALILAAAISQVECFTATGAVGLPRAMALRSSSSSVRRAPVVGGLRMADKEGKEDPYAVKQEVPSFAKEDNQWELDTQAGLEAGDQKKKLVAITTGAFAFVISIVYLLAVVALESRGDMKPAPPEAYGAFDFEQASAILVALANL